VQTAVGKRPGPRDLDMSAVDACERAGDSGRRRSAASGGGRC
jgi:hypothetical protein